MYFEQYKREKKNQLHSIQEKNPGNNDTSFVILLYADINSIQQQLCITHRYQFGVWEWCVLLLVEQGIHISLDVSRTGWFLSRSFCQCIYLIKVLKL